MSQSVQSPSIATQYAPAANYCKLTLEEDDQLILKRNPPCHGYTI